MRKITALLAFSFLVTGCIGGVIRSKIAEGIEDSLPQYIGPAKKYSVKVLGPSEPMLRGKFEHLHIEGLEVQISENLMVDRLIVDMDKVEADPETRQIRSVAATVFTAEVAEKSINDYICAARPDIKGLTLDLQEGKLTVTARPSVLGIGVEFKVTGKPVIAGKDKINFVADSASLARLPIPALVVNKVLDRMNPVLDLGEMQFPVALTSIAIKNDAVIINGKAEFKTAK
ncbi:MAG: DUF2993 domain-containing protein [Armatimonadota bacterium]|nr:DUF2993 domain-containing protein [Armatimonadota bacterium]